MTMASSHLIGAYLAISLMVILLNQADALPRKPYSIEVDYPDNVMEVLSRIGKNLHRNDFYQFKRNVDFGLGRGFSGTQAAKHLMGLAAANYAVGPGRKKRMINESNEDYQS